VLREPLYQVELQLSTLGTTCNRLIKDKSKTTKKSSSKKKKQKQKSNTMRNPTITVSELENNCIAKNTKSRYNSTNYQFVLWLYNNRAMYEGFVCPVLITLIDSVLMSGISERKKKVEIHKLIIGWLEQMTRGDAEQSPLDMNKINYKVVALYMAQKTKGVGVGVEGGQLWYSIRSDLFIYNVSNLTPSFFL
jgi:hypothetical protein